MTSDDVFQSAERSRKKKIILKSFDEKVDIVVDTIIFRQAQINVICAYERLISQHPEYEHDITLKIDFFLKEFKKEKRKLEKVLDKLLEEYKKEE